MTNLAGDNRPSLPISLDRSERETEPIAVGASVAADGREFRQSALGDHQRLENTSFSEARKGGVEGPPAKENVPSYRNIVNEGVDGSNC